MRPVNNQGDCNVFVTSFVQSQDAITEMKPVKAALLTFAMISAIVIGGMGIYAADASADHIAIDGYGVTASVR